MGNTRVQAGKRHAANAADPDWFMAAETLAVIASVDGSKWTLGLAASLNSPGLQAQVAELARRTNPPNPFFDIPMLSTAIGQIGKPGMKYLTLSEQVDGAECLRLFAPIQMTRSGIPGHRVWRVWSNFYWPISSPLIDHANLEFTAGKLAEAIAGMDEAILPAILFEDMDLDSPFARAIVDAPFLRERTVAGGHHERAILRPLKSGTYDQNFISGKRRQRLAKARQRLDLLGQVSYESASTPKDVEAHLEEFLHLESRGWKGRRGTALQMKNHTATFARQVTVKLAKENQCSIHTLRLDGKVLASIIVFRSGGYYFPWKTAFDEQFAKFSVGVLLLTQLNHQLTRTPGFAGIDSLAAKDNVTARQIWPQRLQMGHLVIGPGTAGGKRAKSISRALEREAFLRSTVKRLLRR